MAWLETNHGRLLVGFRFRGERCREYLGLDDNRDNRRPAAKTGSAAGARYLATPAVNLQTQGLTAGAR
jgi:Arm domain-containing DNA-binding protein